MFIPEVLIGIYMLVAALAALMTYDEQLECEDRSVVFSILGYVACLFWPLTLMIVLVLARVLSRTT